MVLNEDAQIHRLVPDVDRFEAVTAAEGDIAALVEAGAFRGEPLASQWTPIRVWIQEEYPGQVRHEEADLLGFISGCLVLTERARSVLGDVLERTGELLPLEAAKPMYVFNCTNVVDAIDIEHTKGVKFPSGIGYMRVEAYAMRRSAVSGQDAFKIPERVASDIFVSRRVSSLIVDSELSGVRHIPVATY
ncbi:MAG: hypothetical protein J2P27_00795 [Actinobacteria bacterium]|nr:hypothetical protein [Actinomycetota bacterium]